MATNLAIDEQLLADARRLGDNVDNHSPLPSPPTSLINIPASPRQNFTPTVRPLRALNSK